MTASTSPQPEPDANHADSRPSMLELKVPGTTRKLKLKRSGVVFIGHDGVFRSFDGKRNVVDAIALSTLQIKQVLDRMPWDQETEDRFRGVDGRKVTDYKEMFDPEDETLRPPRRTDEEKEILRKEVQEINRKKMEEFEQEKKNGVDVEAKYACGTDRSCYNLDPK